MSHSIIEGQPNGPRLEVECLDGSKTRQSEAAACDVNNIVARFAKTGVMPTATAQGFYGDVSELTDYRAALDKVRAADAAFMQLPAEIRREFDNDPATFLDFMSDPANLETAREMGLVERAPEPSALSKAKAAKAAKEEPPAEPPPPKAA